MATRHSSAPRSRRLVPRLTAVVALAAGTALMLGAGQPASAGIVATVDLGDAADYSVLGGTTVTNTDTFTELGQSLGVSPGTAIDGFPPGEVLAPATIQRDPAITLEAQSDLTIAYNNAAGRPVEFTHTDPDLVDLTLVPGVYAAGTLELSGRLVLDGEHNPDAVFIFKAASTLITSSSSEIQLINGASECNVFWQVGSSATLGSGSSFVGTIMALTSITVESGAVVQGRALARNGAVTLDDNVFTQPSCVPTAYVPTTTTIAPTTTAPPTETTAPPVETIPAPPSATTPETPIATTTPFNPTDITLPRTGSEVPTTMFNPTDITLPRTGASLTSQSGIGFVFVLIGLAALVIARRRQPA